MKKLLILGGSSVRNREFVEWFYNVAVWHAYLPTAFSYDHRESGENELDREREIQKLHTLDLKWFDAVVAKSMGTGLIAQLLQGWLFSKSVRVLFLWVPLRVAQELKFSEYYDNLKGIAIIQNEFDPTGSYQMISDYFLSHESIIVKCIEGDISHSYDDFESYLSIIV